MYIVNIYEEHATNQKKGCVKRQYGSIIAVDSNLTLVHQCFYKEGKH